MIWLAMATAALVFLRAFQQQNVQHTWYWWAVLTSYGMALSDAVVVLGVVEYGLAAVPYLGTGGAIGVTSAMYVHGRMRRGG